VIAGADETERHALLNVAWRTYLPARTLMVANAEAEKLLPVLEGKTSQRATAYVCFQYACQAPVHTTEELTQELQKMKR
jgi:uncharacterized protein YyaL (SSP411 family)